MVHSQLFTAEPAHLTGAELGRAVAVLRKSRRVCLQRSAVPAVFRLGTRPDKPSASQSVRRVCRIQGPSDILPLTLQLLPAVSEGSCPGQMKKNIEGPALQDAGKRCQVSQITGNQIEQS